MAAMTVFYGSFRSLQNVVDTVIEVDTAITNLQKVMNRDTNFSDMLDSAIDKAKNLGQTVTDVLSSFELGAKQGLNTEDIGYLTDASLITANVGEMEAAQSAEYLTAAIAQMKLEYKDSMSIIDAWNNISNNNATTIEKLAAGHTRAGATAKSMGLDINELNAVIGTLTQVTKQSGKEIGNFIKSSFPRLYMSDVQSQLESIGVSVKDSSGEMKSAIDVYKEVADVYKDLSSVDKGETGLALGGRFHISRVQSLLTNMDLYNKQLEDSRKSAGSAAAENVTYMQSINAQQKVLAASWQEMALQMGETVITPMYRNLLDTLTGLANSGTKLVEKFGLLPPLFGTVTVAILLLSNTAKKWILTSYGWKTAVAGLSLGMGSLNNKMKMATATASVQTAGLTGLSKATKTATISVRTLGMAFKGLLISTGVGIGVVLLTTLIGKLMEKSAQASAKQRELESQLKRSAAAYDSNRGKVSVLVDEYDQLSNITARTADEDSRYKQVQNELAQILPSVVDNIDAKGNAHLRNVDAIKKEIEYYDVLSAKEAKTRVDSFGDDVSDITGQWKQAIEDMNNAAGIDSIYDKVDFGKMSKEEIANYNIALAEKNRLERQASERAVQLSSDYSKYMNIMGGLTESEKKHVQSIIDSNDKASDREQAIKSYIVSLSGLDKQIRDTFSEDQIDSFSDSQIDNLNELANAIKNQKDGASGSKAEVDRLTQSLVDNGFSTDEASTMVLKMSSALRDEEDAADSSAKAIEANEKAAKELTKTYDESVSMISFLNQTQKELQESHSLSAETIGQLMKKYPSLLKYMGDEAEMSEAIEKAIVSEGKTAKEVLVKKLASNENFFNKMLKGNSKLFDELGKFYGVDFTNFKTLAEAKEKVGQKLINSMSSSWAKYYRATAEGIKLSSQEFNKLGEETGGASTMKTRAIQFSMDRMNSKLEKLSSSFDDISAMSIDTDFSNIGLSMDDTSSSADKASDSIDESSESMSHSKYIADEYAEALEKVNAELKIQSSIQNDYADHSSQYRKSISKEISLLKEKQKLLKQQSSSLNNQIKSGKIAPTGVITTTTSSSSSRASGSGRESAIWNFLQSKGFSDNVVAGIMGNLKLESGLSSTARNSSSGAYGIAQWLGGRKTGLSNYASSKGTGMGNINTQLDYLWKELNSTEKRTLNYLKSNQGSSASTIAAMFDKLFERSEGTTVGARQKYANQFYREYSGAGGGDHSKNVAENKSNVDSAKSDLLNIKQEVVGIDDQIQQLYMDIVNSKIAEFDQQKSSLKDNIALEEFYASKYEETSTQFRQRKSNIAELKKQQADYAKQSIGFMERQLKENKNLNNAQRSQLSDNIESAKSEYYGFLQAVKGINNEIKQSYNAVADEIIATYKEAYGKQQEIAIDANENEMKILEDSHSKKMDMLDEEMSAYEDLIQAKIDSIDKDEEDSNYAEDLAEKQKERIEIQRKIQILSLDDSISARNEVSDLQKKLKEKKKEIDEFTSDRERKLRKDSLQSQLEEKKQQIDSEKEVESSNFDQQKHQLDVDKENIQQYYENLLNDERKFARIRKQILNDNTVSLTKSIRRFSKDIKNNMEIVGRSISQNLLDKLATAQGLLGGVGLNYGSNATSISRSPAGFASGGYTGGFNGGKLALLHEKELVLNSRDTENMLNTVNLVRGITSKIPKLNNASNTSTKNESKNYFNIDVTMNEVSDTNKFYKELNDGLQGLGVQFKR